MQTYGRSVEFKLFRNPWNCGTDGHDGIHGRNMLLHLISALGSRSWVPVLSADVSAKYVHQENGPDYPIDVDSIFFTYDPLAAQGPPPAPPSFAPAYPQGLGQPYSQPLPQGFGQPYPQAPAHGFAPQGASPPFNPSDEALPPPFHQ